MNFAKTYFAVQHYCISAESPHLAMRSCTLTARRMQHPTAKEKSREKAIRDARHRYGGWPAHISAPRTAGPAVILLAAVIAIELSIVGITVLLNSWNTRFYNALQDRNWNAFVYQLGYFCVLAAAFILLAVYQLYLNQWLQIRWRRWMTASYLDHWLAGANHYRMQLLGDAADNPDQRISEDIAQFIASTLNIGLQLLNSLRHAVLFHDHPVGVVGGGAAASVRHHLQHSRLPVVGGADLRRRRHRAHASDRPRR